MEHDFYIVIEWPDIQFYMELDGFRENAYLINDDQGMKDFGSSAYFVSFNWIKSIKNE